MADNNNIVYLAKSNFRGEEEVFGIYSNNEDRFQHMYVIGQSGTGKSTLLKNIAKQDILAGRGIALVDPHGEFAEELIESIPPERINDVVYFNPIDTDYPIGFNPIEVTDPEQKHLVASGLMAIFTKIWANVWSARMEYILMNCILALIDTPNQTLLGIPRILVDKDYRKMIVNNCKDPVVKGFWVNEFEKYQDKQRTEAIAPIQNKVGQFLSTHIIRNIVGQPTSSMNIADLMNQGKILIANVSKGQIGEDNSGLIGAMLITKIQLAAMERVKIKDQSARRPFLLYVDEFQNFATDSFASILSEARKYKLGLVVAHQYIGQLVTDTSTKVRDAIFGNVGTIICFRVGAPDAEFLEKQFAPDLTMEDMANLPNRQIFLRLMMNGVATRPFSASTLAPIPNAEDPQTAEKVIHSSRTQYGRSREEVEKMILEWSQPIVVESTKGQYSGSGDSYQQPPKKPYNPNYSNNTGSQSNYNKPRSPYPPRDYNRSNSSELPLSDLEIEPIIQFKTINSTPKTSNGPEDKNSLSHSTRRNKPEVDRDDLRATLAKFISNPQNDYALAEINDETEEA